MNKLWFKALLIAAVVTHCGSADAGWFDNKKKSTEQAAQQTADSAVQKAKEVLQVQPAAPAAASNGGSSALATPAAQGTSQFLDFGNNTVKTSAEAAEEAKRRGPQSVRLSDEEAEEVKEQMNRLRKDVAVAQSVKGFTQLKQAKEQVATLPAVPKAPAVPVKPATYKAVNTGGASGYKR